MFIIYDLIFLLISLLYLPSYIFRGKFHAGFWQRLGLLPRNLPPAGAVWVHAVSVGEAAAMKGLLEEIRRRFPEKRIVFSTVTATGNQVARAMLKAEDCLIYLPLDFSFIVRRVLAKFKPALFIIAETEIWPNLISCLYRHKVPLAVVNGRISDRSFAGYSRIRPFLRPLLNKISAFCVQAQRDKERLMRLGVAAEKIEVTGNMKFDTAPDRQAGVNTDKRKKLGLAPEDKLWVCGSTHPGEEKVIFTAYKDLLVDFPRLKLLVAPRHPQRCAEIERLAQELGLRALSISHADLTNLTGTPVAFLLDTVGELVNYYAVADIVFVGGSLVKKGGHNILEPALFAKPIIFGPQMFNFRDIAELFLAQNAAVMVYNGKGLKENVARLLRAAAGNLLGGNARALIAQNQGATARNMQIIARLLALANTRSCKYDGD